MLYLYCIPWAILPEDYPFTTSMNSYKKEAQEWLGFLRNGTSEYDPLIGYVREEAAKGNLSLADIGTSEEELAQLRVKGCMTAAQEWLGFLRNGASDYDLLIEYVREEATKGNLSLADIGTSEEELASFRKVPA
jgi:uncharacterized membrane protein